MKRIAGIISKKSDEKSLGTVRSMLARLDHIKSDEIAALKVNGSVLGTCGKGADIKGRSSDIAKSVVLDGKIYNIDDLLAKNGLKNMIGKSQEEKVLALYEKNGDEVFKEFTGSYAIALKWHDDFLLARDVIGKKPLYYSISSEDGKLFFGSEIKAFGRIKENVNELKPGHILNNFTKSTSIKKIENKDIEIDYDKGKSSTKSKLNDLLLESIEKRISDQNCKLGVWLSGGVDSSIVAALLKEFSDKVYTFSVGFEGSPDLESAKIVAKHIGSEHNEYHLDVDELIGMIPEVIYHLESFDAPLVRSSMGNFITAKLSSEANIVFSGEGGDEVFGGYNYFLDLKSSEIIQEGLFDAINSLHNTALQRVDRLANAYGVNIKLPLLDENLVNFALKIPPSEKVKKDISTTKVILREVADDYLPEEIAWREKEKFWEGSGILTRLEENIEDKIDDTEFEDLKELEEGFKIRSKEELYYYRIYKNMFPDVDFSNVIAFTSDF